MTLSTRNQKSSPTVRRIATSLRKLVSEVYLDTFEVPWPKLRIIGYGIESKKNTQHFCYIAYYSTHVNLGFNHGWDLSDPNGILEGTGKKFRHVKIGKLSDVNKPALRQLLSAAVQERKQAPNENN